MRYRLNMPRIETTGVKYDSNLVSEIRKRTNKFLTNIGLDTTNSPLIPKGFNVEQRARNNFNGYSDHEPPQAA